MIRAPLGGSVSLLSRTLIQLILEILSLRFGLRPCSVIVCDHHRSNINISTAALVCEM